MRGSKRRAPFNDIGGNAKDYIAHGIGYRRDCALRTGWSLFFEHIPNWARQSRFVYYLSLRYALIVWLMKGFATLYCVPLGIAVCGVVVCPDISPRTKAIVFIIGGFSYLWLAHWAGTIRSFG
jgi:hypothetical protein